MIILHPINIIMEFIFVGISASDAHHTGIGQLRTQRKNM